MTDGVSRLRELATYFPGAAFRGETRFEALCPCHDDHNPSFAADVGDDGTIVLGCWAGCDNRDIMAAVGASWSLCFPDGGNRDFAPPINRVASVRVKSRPAIDLEEVDDVRWRPLVTHDDGTPVDNLSDIDRDAELDEVAADLGVPAWSLAETGTVCLNFTTRKKTRKAVGTLERDHIGFVGFLERTPGGKKRALGSTSGLCFADQWDKGGPVYIPEGPSCTAAIYSLGLSVIGRPSNTLPKDTPVWLAKVIGDVSGREIRIIAERDNGPGVKGARQSASRLASALQSRVAIYFPPGEFKDSREWYRNTTGPTAEIFESGLELVEWVDPPEIYRCEALDGPEISLGDYRQEMLAKRLEIIQSGPQAYLDRSPTGAGKTYADVEAICRSNVKAYMALPTHDNCDEVLDMFWSKGVYAAKYPARVYIPPGKESKKQANCWEEEADAVEAMGLPVMKTVCLQCDHRSQCNSHGYLAGVRAAHSADVSLSTHARAEHAGLGDMVAGKQFASIHENPIQTLRPRVDIFEGDIAELRRVTFQIFNGGFAGVAGNLVPYSDYVAARERQARERHEARQLKRIEEGLDPKPYHEFDTWGALQKVADFVDGLFHQISGTTSNVEWVPPDAIKVNSLAAQTLYFACRKERARFDGSPFRFLLAAVSGQVRSAIVICDERSSEDTARRIVGFKQNEVPGVASLFSDATLDSDRLGMVAGRDVVDITPDGHIPLQKRAVQIIRDLTRQASPNAIADAVGAVVGMFPSARRIGLITHSRQLAAVKRLLKTGLPPGVTLERSAYFGSGDDRSSNQWHVDCDLLIVAGTPRVSPAAIAEYLTQCGEIASALSPPDWSNDISWEGVNEAGESVIVERTRGYRDLVWRRAYRDLVRASLIQAVGRGRGLSPDGADVVVLTTEEVGLPVMSGTPVVDGERRSVLADQIVSLIELRAGAGVRTQTKDIASIVGKSRPTVAKELKRLESEGVVRHVAGDGKHFWEPCVMSTI